jgi:hypothetical protein
LAKPVYVEIQIRAPLDEVWRLTQEPDLHARWDLRFTDIEYLPRPDDSQPQRFLYTTRIGFGIAIAGTGASAGSSDGELGRTSALRFGSEDPKSLIREGSGYWRYQPNDNGVRFLTSYGYDVRFGRLGRWFDALVFRPLIGWATAWSFDRLRIWLERGVAPEISLQRSIVHALARLTLAFVWIYHGLVPKILFPERGELDLLREAGLFAGREAGVLTAIGLAEIGFGLLLIALWRHRWPLVVAIGLLLALGAGAVVVDPAVVAAPFNPVSFTFALIALAAIGLVSARDLPSAGNCIRATPGGTR